MISGSLCLSLGCEEVMNVARLDIFLVFVHITCFSLGLGCCQFTQDIGIKGQLLPVRVGRVNDKHIL